MAVKARSEITLASVSDGKPGDAGANGHMLYGVCDTAAGTAAKTVNINGFSLYAGVTIAVMFQNGNTAISPTINVNGTGAKSIYTNGVKYMYAGIRQCVLLVYDSSGYWYVCSQPVYADTATIGNPIGGNVFVDGDSVDIRKGSKVLSQFRVDTSPISPNITSPFIEGDGIVINGISSASMYARSAQSNSKSIISAETDGNGRATAKLYAECIMAMEPDGTGTSTRSSVTVYEENVSVETKRRDGYSFLINGMPAALSQHADGYWGIVNPDGDDQGWTRTAASGILPYRAGGSSQLGSSYWPFSEVHTQNIYVNGNRMNDFIVAQGSSGGWAYRKWASGEAECWCYVKHYTGNFAWWDSDSYICYGTNKIQPTPYPFTFVNEPAVFATTGTNNVAGFLVLYINQPVDNSKAYFPSGYVCLPAGGTYGPMTAKVNMYALGRWK